MAGMTLALTILLIVIYLAMKMNNSSDAFTSLDSGNSSWNPSSNGSFCEPTTHEKTPLLYSMVGSNQRLYTEEKVHSYGNSRKMDNEVKKIH